MISLTKKRTRRRRKKLRVGEFQEMGFEVSFDLRPGLDENELDSFWDAFIVEAIEGNGLAFGGSTQGFIATASRGSATDDHRERVRSWLTSRAEIVSVNVAPLTDAWHIVTSENTP